MKYKTLVGGGDLKMVNGTVGRALARLGYRPDVAAPIVAHIEEHGTGVGAPGIRPEHLPVFATAMGDNRISPEGHLRMMAAVQPFLSGAISKTVNLAADATAGDIEDLFLLGWQLGLKAVAVYRDGSKVAQPMTTKNGDGNTATPPAVRERRELPRNRQSSTTAWRVADFRAYLTVGQYDDGQPGEVFVAGTKQGSTMSGLLDAWAIAVSHGLQHGVPLESYVKAYRGMRFRPCGDHRRPRPAGGHVGDRLHDAAHRPLTTCPSTSARSWACCPVPSGADQPLPGLETAGVVSTPAAPTSDAPLCSTCGTRMVRAGSCHACTSCGTTSGW